MHTIKAKLQLLKNQQQPFNGLPRALDEQKQLDISSTAFSLQQEEVWGRLERY